MPSSLNLRGEKLPLRVNIQPKTHDMHQHCCLLLLFGAVGSELWVRAWIFGNAVWLSLSCSGRPEADEWLKFRGCGVAVGDAKCLSMLCLRVWSSCLVPAFFFFLHRGLCFRLEGKERSRELRVSELQGFCCCFRHRLFHPAACSILGSPHLHHLIRLCIQDIYLNGVFFVPRELSIRMCVSVKA